MTNEQKIKELEAAIEYLNETNNTRITEILKEIQELKKPKYELYEKNTTLGFVIEESKYNIFKDAKQRDYYQNGWDIYCALANFASKYDDYAKFVWGIAGLNQKKWYIEIDALGKISLNFSTSIRKLGVVYLSTKELAIIASKMLEDKGLLK